MFNIHKTKIFICDSVPNRGISKHIHVKTIQDPALTATLQPSWTTSKEYSSDLFNSLDYEPSNQKSYQQHCYSLNNSNNINNHHQSNIHTELIRTDSGNSSLNTIDSISNHSSRSLSSSINDGCCPYYGSELSTNLDDDSLLINVFVPETQSEFDITCSYRQSIWYVKTVLIERLCGNTKNGHNNNHRNSRLLRDDQCLNYGLFSAQLGLFLDEQLTFNEYFWNKNNHSGSTNTIINYNNNDDNLPILINHNHFNPDQHQSTTPPISKQSHQRSYNNNTTIKKNTIVKLEFLYKQRVKYGEIMSTLPLASATRKKRKRSRLLTAIQNGNLDKLAKALVNCDPNFVDESSGDTPLSIAASLSISNSTTQQQIIVAIVNGGALLDFRTKDGRTALHVAVQKSNFIALKTLLDLGASPNYPDTNGLTPLYYSVIHKANPKLTQLLLYEHANLGIIDQHGWQEIHHASKLGLVQHLEHLLFYGCDMNSRIIGSGNTSLHVAAINDQVECARILLLRGCDTSIVNNSHQNAYQVAVIAGNMSLADYIKDHKQENVVPYRDKPRYNPARRPATHSSHDGNQITPNKSKLLDVNGGAGSGRSISPSLSQLTNNTTTTSSGVCCDDEDDPNNQTKQQRSVMNNGNNIDNAQPDYDDNEDDDDDDNEQNGNIIPSSESEDSTVFTPGMMVKAISDYNSGDPSHMQLRRNDHVLLLHSDHSPPTIASQKLLLGRRCLDNQEGYFPACCVEKIKPIKDTDSSDRVEGRRDMKMKNMQAATLPTRGRRGARKSYLDKSTTRQYQDRTVTLHRGSKGFGFVLRGAKDSSPVLTKQLLQQQGSVPLIGLQYFDEIEVGGVADAAGLKRGDFLLAVNDVDVRHMSHENVVQLIRQSGDKVTMTIATPVPKQLVSILKKKGKTGQTNNYNANKQQQSPVADSKQTNGMMPPPPPLPTSDTMSSSQSQIQMSQSVYASFNNSNRGTKAPPPAPPKRDPSTTLSNTSRARARSLVVASEVRTAHNQALILLNEVKTAVDDDKTNETKKYSSNADTSESITDRSRSMRRISSFEPTEYSINNNSEDVCNSKAETTNKNEKVAEIHKRDSFTMSPPASPPNHSIVDVTLVKGPIRKNNEKQQQQQQQQGLLSSFQPATSKQDNESNIRPQIPDPDYSSDEDEKNKKKNASISTDTTPKKAEKIKLMTKATVVLKSTSPCPPETDIQITEPKSSESLKNGIIGSKNIFDELKEQSAKITSAARLRFATTESDGIVGTAANTNSSQVSTKAPNNVKKNVAEFEKRLNGSSISKDQMDSQQLRMSKSCMEDFTPQQSAMMNTLKKEIITKPNLRQKQPCDQSTDFRRNSAIISAMAEKVAAVNQLVAEQQQQQTGSKSLNSSPIPATLGKVPGQVISNSTVVVQKPIAILPGASSGSLIRRCVTVCEDPVKAIHLQQQHQQLRSQLAGTSMVTAGGTLTRTKPTHSSSLAEPTTSSILKQPSKSQQQQIRSINQQYHSGTTTTGSIDVVPPPPEFAVPLQQPTIQSNRQISIQQQPITANQKIYLQRQLQSSSSTTSPITIQQQQQQSGSSQVHHQHSQLISGEPMPHPPHYSHQATHYQLHHNHPAQTTSTIGHGHQLSSSAPTNTDGHTLMAMRQSILAAQQQQQQQQQPLTSTSTSTSNYDYLVQQQQQHQHQRATNPLVSHHHHHQLPQSSNTGQSQYSQQQQNQLLLQQRALAVANAKLYQQQQQLRSGGGQYNTLASSKPQQIQYYITQQQSNHPQHQHHHHHHHPTGTSSTSTASTTSTQQPQQQYFATLGRNQHAQMQQQYLNPLTSQQQQMQQQQFATLTRHHQQQILQQQQQPSTLQQQQQQNLLNYSQLIQRQQQQQQLAAGNTSATGTGRMIQTSSATVGSSSSTRQTSMSTAQVPSSKVVYTTTGSGQPTAAMQYQYHQSVVQQQQQQQQQQQLAYARKSVVEWTIDDVQEWLQRIGMAEHRLKFESFNGAKMLRLDNNSLANIGVRQQQHRIYILEKLKQQIWQNHQ